MQEIERLAAPKGRYCQRVDIVKDIGDMRMFLRYGPVWSFVPNTFSPSLPPLSHTLSFSLSLSLLDRRAQDWQRRIFTSSQTLYRAYGFFWFV